MKKLSVGLLSLGCPKNLVDSEVILGLLRVAGYPLARDVAHADIAVLNTCAFIEDARRESIDRLLELIELKKQGQLKFIILAGCLPQKYTPVIKGELDEIDAFVGTGEFPKVVEIIERLSASKKQFLIGPPKYIYDDKTPRIFLTPNYSRYLKISEGCDHRCAFCTIPEMRGRYRSRSLDSILKEARQLAKYGPLELNLIGQDITYYGLDIRKRYLIVPLIKKLARISAIHWIRLLYTYPTHISDELIDCISDTDEVCNYIDMALQHISDRMLKSMRRGITKAKTLKLLRKLRRRIPNLAIRTSFIVGYPGETKRDFEELKTFIKEFEFERLGVFLYSKEEGTPAAKLTGEVPLREARRRFDELMIMQQEVSRENNKKWLGKTLEVLIEFRQSGRRDTYIGRSYMDAPEVDGQVYVHSRRKLALGSFKKVRITATKEYDLTGVIV